MSTKHDFIWVKTGESQFAWVIYCKTCGYVSYFGNAVNSENRERQQNLPKSCIGLNNQVAKRDEKD